MKMRLALMTTAAFLLSGIAYTQTAHLVGSGGNGVGVSPVPHGPFSAEIHSESNRALADGNRIHEEWQEKLCRDSEGRTRTEKMRVVPATENAELPSVNIFDPVQKVNISLNQRMKVAIVRHFPEVTRTSPEPRVAPGENRTVPHSEPRMRNLDQATTRAEADGRVIKTEKLGTREIDGLSATGTRTTITIPAGVEGNSEAIVVVREGWFSPELKLELQSTNDDPRSGRTTRTVENVQRGDPDPLLFQVPADYTVKDDKVKIESGAAFDSASALPK